MSIWPPPSGDVPPIPASRSGSPDRRSIYDGRRYYEAYPPDQYPYDRDGYGRDRHYPPDYDRERDWAEWDRRRLATRGRSRSPVLDDGPWLLSREYDQLFMYTLTVRRKRRRSYSPHERDRYDPRPRYDDGKCPWVAVTGALFSSLASKDSRGLGRARSPGSYPPRGGGSRFPDPYELDVPANFRAFADWFQATHPEEYLSDEGPDGPRDSNGQPNGLRRRYERYRKVMISKQVSDLIKKSLSSNDGSPTDGHYVQLSQSCPLVQRKIQPC
jgi:serrate RNA effector molecule